MMSNQSESECVMLEKPKTGRNWRPRAPIRADGMTGCSDSVYPDPHAEPHVQQAAFYCWESHHVKTWIWDSGP